MKLQILQENLEKAVGITSKFTNNKAQLPILGNILLSARKSKILISSTNLEISACVQTGAKIEEEGEISIPSKTISDLILNLPKETIDIESDKEQLRVSTSDFSSVILGMDSTDFPKVPSSVDEKHSLTFVRKDMVDALSKVNFATSTDETRPILTGVLFVLKGNKLSLVATDGFRLSQKHILLNESRDINKTVVIPKNILVEIGRNVFSGENVLFDLEDTEKQVVFGLEDTVLTSRILEGDYPDFEKIIPKGSNIKVYIDKEELLRAVKLASIFARESANVVKIKVLKESIKIYGESGQTGNQETKIDAKIERSDSNDFEIAFNYRYLEDFIHSVTGEEILMEFNNSTSASVFKDTSDNNYLHLIMPVKV